MLKRDNPQAVRVLLVEDSLPMRARIRSLIEESGSAEIIGETGSVTEALALLRAHPTDAVVLDLNLEDGDGCTVMIEIKRTRPACVVIVLTCFPDEEFRAFCLHSGADYFFDKSREFERVPEVLATLHRPSPARSRLSQELAASAR